MAEPIVIRIVEPAGAAHAWIALALLAAALAALAAWWLARRTGARPRHEDRAAGEERSGHALLRLAREIDEHAAELERAGAPSRRHRLWARQCRVLAAERLERINALILEEMRGAAARGRGGGGA
ncbi:hypothetical protein [Vulcaniibacterium tengchongense]|uniref:Uncharacterized protein n=1 Tax=Vulcaniibacterium tengchongense TaxID=1273429 RepID=A0A3N4W684_9GAMM|nr:hypothetical protein [Vulcaniibacterium tengchongense]RPE81600.1 hypothetical protein EDC50_0792 [Vulcaniibacterium tengchongense]